MPERTEQHVMPQMINLSASGLRRSQRIKDLDVKKKAEESHPTSKFKSAFSSKRILGLFTILSTVTSNITSPIIAVHNNATQQEKLINRFHEANELFDGTLNVLRNTVLVSDTSTNECYNYSQAMKQQDADEFKLAMEVDAHEKRGHWTMVLRSSIPQSAKTIQSIWSFEL